MLNLLVEKKSSEVRDQSVLSITRPMMGIAMGFVQQSRLSSCLVFISINIKIIYYFHLFYFNVAALT